MVPLSPLDCFGVSLCSHTQMLQFILFLCVILSVSSCSPRHVWFADIGYNGGSMAPLLNAWAAGNVCGRRHHWANRLFSPALSLFTCYCSQLPCSKEEKGMIYVCSDNNKCLGCSGARALPYPVELAEAQSHWLCSNFHLWRHILIDR